MRDLTKIKNNEWLDLNDKVGVIEGQMLELEKQLDRIYAEMEPLEAYFAANNLEIPPTWKKVL